MTLPANRQTRNLRLSVTNRIGESLTVTAPGQVDGAPPVARTVPVYHNWWLADPDSAGAPAGTQEPAFVGTRWLSAGAGWRGTSILQCDVYTRIGKPGADTGDTFGLFNCAVSDALAEPFAGINAAGVLNAYVPILDFTDPENPVAADGCLICQTPGGDFGVWSDRRDLGRAGGFFRTVVRFNFRTTTDAIRGAGTAIYQPVTP